MTFIERRTARVAAFQSATTICEYTGLFESCQNAQVGWLVDFTSSAVADIFPREGREPEPSEKCLVTAARISEVKALAIKAIKSAAENGRLISHPRLPYILFRCREFAGDDSVGVKAWTGEQLRSDEAASMLAKAFTGQSWSQGMGMFGLGDRVAMRNVRASVNGLDHVIDVKEFRRRLEEIENSDALESRYKGSVSIFLEAWRKQEAGDEH